MCPLAFYFQAFSRYPIVAAANRDEFFTKRLIACEVRKLTSCNFNDLHDL
jgi:uncharacterized protein with NRDE domain